VDLTKTVWDSGRDGKAVGTRYYFDLLQLSVAPLRLSVYTASRLPPDIRAVKQALTFSLVQFERAPVTVQAYVKSHLFETMDFIQSDLSKVRHVMQVKSERFYIKSRAQPQ